MGVENRRAMRVNAAFYVKLGCDVAESKKKWEENIAKNVSECGLAITTSYCYPQNSILTLLLRIPTQQTLDWVEASGKVIDCTKIMDNAYITRIDFIDLHPSIKEAIKRYVEWASTK
ncbi:MAG: PilZ domain-containing protein [Candidatus Omnitrophota bacterium]